MFVSTMTEQQQGVLLYLADIVINADGSTAEAEVRIFESLAAQCGGEAEKTAIEFSQLSDVFVTRRSASALMLELLGVAHADDEYHETEQRVIQKIATALHIDDTLLEDMTSWVYRQFCLMKEAETFMEEV